MRTACLLVCVSQLCWLQKVMGFDRMRRATWLLYQHHLFLFINLIPLKSFYIPLKLKNGDLILNEDMSESFMQVFLLD